jgi:hypothetical protein
MPEARVGKGDMWPGASQIGGGLPIPTKAPDQTKIQVVLHVEHPTKPYQILCSRSETDWGIWIGHPTAYQPLPHCRSGSTAVLWHYYQTLPAAELNTHTMIASIIFLVVIVGLLAYAQYIRNRYL